MQPDPILTTSERVLILRERDDLVADLHRMVGNQLAIRAGHMPVKENSLLGFQIDACRRHLTRLETLLGNQTADHGNDLDSPRAVVGRKEV